jgi:hypothetical protein
MVSLLLSLQEAPKNARREHCEARFLEKKGTKKPRWLFRARGASTKLFD